ncbi:VIT1/CCC1 transporter family protein [Leucobacter insecticola]|uniref:VIT1/CCC1 transporter family protein n=1 Tax=Leucobacter insecticola TaxID=2714934 RepID=UPI001FCA7452|nr:VIT1/CCC1 transporter family protein [Leucobacter insecticola]
MSLGEYASVRTANEQVDAEVRVEREAHDRNPEGEKAELAQLFERLGMETEIAQTAAEQVHGDAEQAILVHISHELGMSPDEKPSPWVAAISSLFAFGIGALIPILPFIFGFGTLGWGLALGGIGLLLAGGIAARFTRRNWLAGAARQLLFGGLAVGVTYTIGKLLGVSAIA